MDKETIEGLKADAERRCNELYQQGINTNTELERARGDFRTYESLLLNWEDRSIKGQPIDNLFKPKENVTYKLDKTKKEK